MAKKARAPAKVKATSKKTDKEEEGDHVCKCSRTFATAAGLRTHQRSCATISAGEENEEVKRDKEKSSGKEKKREREVELESPYIDTEMLAAYKTSRALRDLVGTPKNPLLHPKIRMVMQQGMFGGTTAVRKAVGDAVSRLAQGSRRLLQEAVDSGAGENFYEGADQRNPLLYDALVPVAAAYLESEAAEYGIILEAERMEVLGRNPEMFQYVTVLSQACSKVNLRRSVREGPRTFEGPRVERSSKTETAKCFNCDAQGHIARHCPKAMRCRICKKEGHRARDCRVSQKPKVEVKK